MCHSVSTGIFSNTGHCYHYPAQSFNSRGNCFEMGRLNQLNSTVSLVEYDFVESATETVKKMDLGSTFHLEVTFHVCRI